MSDNVAISEELAECCKKTINTLQDLIKKPSLTERYLAKPPFKYLHDIVNNFITKTGYFQGLYTADELDKEKAQASKETKIAFLQKIITAAECTLGVKLDVKPNKIASGVEPEKTNELLQALAQCVLDKKDWQAGMKKMNASDDRRDSKKDEKSEKSSKDSKEDRDNREKDHKKKETKEKESKEKEKESKEKESKEKEPKEREHKEKEPKEKESKEKESKEKEHKEKESKSKDSKDSKEKDKKEDSKKSSSSSKVDVPKLPLGEEKKSETSVPKDTAAPAASSQPAAQDRPATARKPPPKIASNVLESDSRALETTKKDEAAPTGVILDKKKMKGSQKKEEPDDSDEDTDKLPLEALTASTSNVNEGPGKGYLSQMTEKERKPSDGQAIPPPDGGQGIILHRKTTSNQKESLEVELQKLKENLQTLIKSTNPLGKAMEYIQEDFDSMQREHEMWRNEFKQQQLAWQEQQKQTEELLAPLHSHLHDLEDTISDQITKMHATKASILRSDSHIENLLKMMTASVRG